MGTANVPQTWAAGSIFMLTRAMLGFLPDVPSNKPYVDSLLPTWLARHNNSRSSHQSAQIRYPLLVGP